MSQVFTYLSAAGSVNLGTEAVRLGEVPGFVTSAELGDAAISSVVVDNPLGTVGSSSDQITGLRGFTVDENAETAGDQRTYTGYTAERTYRRRQGSSLITGLANEIEVSLTDLNAVLGFRVIQDGDRPSEEVTSRMTWLLADDAMTGLVFDNGQVVSNATVMDAANYTGQKAADVLGDMALLLGWNYFVYFDETAGQASLWFQNSNTSNAWDSGILLTNDLAYIDQTLIDAGTATAFWVMPDAKLVRNPARVFAGVFIPYEKGFVYRTDPTIESNFAWRDGTAANSTVNTSATATTIADRFLTESDTEDDRITCTFQPQASQVNAVKPGYLVTVIFTHLPGYTTVQFMRVMKRTVAQTSKTDQLYQVTVELSPADPAELVATHAQLESMAPSTTGSPQDFTAGFEIVWGTTGDAPDSSHDPNPLTGLVEYQPQYGGFWKYRGLTMLGSGTITFRLRASVSMVDDGDHNTMFYVLKNGIEIGSQGQVTTGGLRFISFECDFSGSTTVVNGDIISALFNDTGSGAGPAAPTFPAGVTPSDLTIDGNLTA